MASSSSLILKAERSALTFMDLGTFLMNKHHEPTQVGITLNGIIIKLILRNILSQMSIKLHSEISDIMDDIKI